MIGSTAKAWHENFHKDRDRGAELPIKDAIIKDETLFENENHSLKDKIRKLFGK